MKTQLSIIVALMLFGVCSAQATTWTSGHHEIVGGDIYGEIWMYNDATLDIFGGDIFRLAAFDTTLTNWYDGEMGILWARDNSTINIYGGTLGLLWAAENSLINLYAYDVIHDPDGGSWSGGQLIGRYLDNDLYFEFDLEDLDSFSHITVVPEPTTFLLFSLGGLLLRKRG